MPDVPRVRSIDLVLGAVVIVLGALLMIAWLSIIEERSANTQPLTITACAPEDFIEEQCTAGPPTPGTVVLDEDLVIEVAGRVQVDSDRPVSYELIEVAWEAVESEVRFPVISVPIEYEANRDEPYEIEWVAPPQLLALIENTPPGESLGRWRIVGKAIPASRDLDVYVWDSVETFTMIAPDIDSLEDSDD